MLKKLSLKCYRCGLPEQDIDGRRDWMYIDDLVSSFVKAIEGKGHLGVPVYNICTGIGSSV